MATRKCEACEGRGKKRRNGWVLCDRCHRWQEAATQGSVLRKGDRVQVKTRAGWQVGEAGEVVGACYPAMLGDLGEVRYRVVLDNGVRYPYRRIELRKLPKQEATGLFTLVAVKGKKVVDQFHSVTPEVLNTAINVMQDDNPGATVSVEDAAGKIVKVTKK